MCSLNFIVNKFALFTNGHRDVKDAGLGLLRMIADSQTEGEYEMNLKTLFCKNVWLYEKNGKKEIGFRTRGFLATKQVFP